MGRDGLLPAGVFAAIHPRFRTPWKATLLNGVVVSGLAAALPLRTLANLVVMSTLLGFIVVGAGVLILRRGHAQPASAFRAPLGPTAPVLAIAVCLLMLASLPVENVLWLAAWLALGIVLYFSYSRRHSVLAATLRPRGEAPGGQGEIRELADAKP
jgi:APA family basic amino acid/polyamine antiporter